MKYLWDGLDLTAKEHCQMPIQPIYLKMGQIGQIGSAV